MNVAFCTHVSDDWFFTIGADKLLKSAKHFHPDIPFYVFNSEQIQTIISKRQERILLFLKNIVGTHILTVVWLV